MNPDSASIVKETLDDQCSHWDTTFLKKPAMFGEHPSDPAQKALELFQKEGLNKILELGAGQGRDTLFFARSGLQIHALDYAESAFKTLGQKAQALGLSQSIKALRHDVRESLPFDKESFDGCYSHMLYCMAFTTRELEFLSDEVRRVLRPGGINVYTVRHTNDPDYGTGMHRGEDMYEVGGFIVHFFSREKVEHLAKGWEIVEIEEFEEGKLPRKLFRVILRKKT
ncbi:MAG: class I SAM-dependent methyltransferase [Candidatus Binatia bacterium]